MKLYHRDGTPYTGTVEEQIQAWGHDSANKELKIVEQHKLLNRRMVSTIWLGLDHGDPARDDLPLIFETMVFARDGESLDTVRYGSEGAAIAGHASACEKWDTPTWDSWHRYIARWFRQAFFLKAK